ncbi:ABC transporter permease [Arthrobacter woluwensis]|uniref:ABC transporter permease n=1 Tax=Arthrobacter woluwensis TaxID=156980 RepID=UPI001AAF6F9A|nr:ABC transporter permease [Arthrobacter woluwensis]QTF71010.1 ABC transporter permease [Arthrobacter woluwensis]
MNPRLLGATTARVLTQIRHDHRSVAMILVVPSFLLAAVYFLFENETLPPGMPRTFDRVGLVMLAIFPFLIMFLITSVTMLRERTSGTLERLLTTPLGKADLLFGYALAFSLLAAVQALVTLAVAYWVFQLDVQGSPVLVGLVCILNSVLGVALGLLCSAFARTEFQAVQFMPVVVVPQILLCGLFVARDSMNSVLEAISNVLPLSYSVEALQEIGRHSDPTETLRNDLIALAVIAFGLLVLASATLRRRTA